jgi:hypothetical protein
MILQLGLDRRHDMPPCEDITIGSLDKLLTLIYLFFSEVPAGVPRTILG